MENVEPDAGSTIVRKTEQETPADQSMLTELTTDGESEATSADFSSIGKDIPFYEDTINYLKDATVQLGAQLGKTSQDLATNALPDGALDLAATNIQSAYRGYKARKDLADDNKNRMNAKKDSHSPSSEDVASQAATKIQSAYKGYRVRRSLPKKDKLEDIPVSTSQKEEKVKAMLPARISREKPLEQTFKPPQASNDLIKPKTDPKITRTMSLNETKALEPEKLNKTKVFKKGQSVGDLLSQVQPQIKPEKSSKPASFKRETKIPSPTKKAETVNDDDLKVSSKIRTNGFRSKLPSSSDLHARQRIVNSKKFARSISVNEKGREALAFDIEAIRKDLLSKKVKTPPRSGSKSKALTKGVKSDRMGSSKDKKISKTISKPTETLEKRLNADPNANKDGLVQDTDQQSVEQASPEASNKAKLQSVTDQPEADGIFDKLKEDINDTTKHNSAITIQKTFRGYRTRKNIPNNQGESPKEPMTSIQNKDITQDVLEPSKTQEHEEEVSDAPKVVPTDQQVVKESAVNTLDKARLQSVPDQPKADGIFDKLKEDVEKLKDTTRENSAIIIQKTYRGYRARKDLPNRQRERLKEATTFSQDKDIAQSALKPSKIEGHKEEIKDEQIVEDMKRKDITPSALEPSKPQRHEEAVRNAFKVGSMQETDQQVVKESSLDTLDEAKLQSRTDQPKADGIFDKLKGDVEKLKDTTRENSAIAIQKTYRGYRARKNLSNRRGEDGKEISLQSKDIPQGVLEPSKTQGHDEEVTNASKVSPMQNKDQQVVEESTLDTLDKAKLQSITDQPKADDIFGKLKMDVDKLKDTTRQNSAITIQKTYRGYRARKDLPNRREESFKEATTSIQIKDISQGAMKPEMGDQQVVEDMRKKDIIPSTFESPKSQERQEEINNSKQASKEKETQLEAEEWKGESKPMPSEQVLNQAATVIQKTYRGHRTRTNILNHGKAIVKTLVPGQKGDLIKTDPSSENTALNATFRMDYPNYEGQEAEETHNLNETFRVERQSRTKAIQTKEKEDSSNLRKNFVQNQINTDSFDSFTPFSDSTSEQISSIVSDQVESDPQEHKRKPDRTLKTSSANALLENAASTIQRAYRNYHSRKGSVPLDSPKRRFSQDGNPIETSDESSTFIGPDTSFDLSDVDSVEPKTDQLTPTPSKANNSESTPPTFSIHLQSDGNEQDNGLVSPPITTSTTSLSAPQTRRRKRSFIEPTAPPLEELLNDKDPKPQWYVGEEPIVSTDETNSTSLLEPPASSSSFDNPDARTKILNSNQQLTTLDNSTVVTSSTSSLLFANDTDTFGNQDSQKLNKTFGTVSAKEEKEEKQESQEDQETSENNKEDEEMKLKRTEEDPFEEGNGCKDDEEKEHVVQHIREGNFLLDSDDPFSVKNSTKDGKKLEEGMPQEPGTELCENCASGIHEVHPAADSNDDKLKDDKLPADTRAQAGNVGGSSDLSKESHFDEVKHFVLMEMGSNSDGSESASQQQAKVIKSNDNDNDMTIKKEDDTDTTSAQSVDREDRKELRSDMKTLKALISAPLITLISASSEDEGSDRDLDQKSVESRYDPKKDDTIQDTEKEIETSQDSKEKSEAKNKENGEKLNKEKDVDQDELKPKTPSSSSHQTNDSENKTDDGKAETGAKTEYEEVAEPTENERAKRTNPDQDENSTIKGSIDDDEQEAANPSEETLNDHDKTKSSTEIWDEIVPALNDEEKPKTLVEGDLKTEKEVAQNDIKPGDKDEDVKPKQETQLSTDALESLIAAAEKQNDIKKPEDSEGEAIKDKEKNQVEETQKKEKTESLELEIASKLISIHQDELGLGNQLPIEGDSQKSITEQKSDSIKFGPVQTQIEEKDPNSATEANDKAKPPSGEVQPEVQMSEPNDEESQKPASEVREDKAQGATEEVMERSQSADKVSPDDKSTSQDDEKSKANGQSNSEDNKEPANIEDQNKSSDVTIGSDTNMEQDSEPKPNQESLEIRTPKDSPDRKKPSIEEAPNSLKKSDSEVQANVEALIQGSASLIEAKDEPIHIPTENTSQEVVEEPCTKKVIPKPSHSVSSDPEESEIESTTPKAYSTTSTPGYDDGSENDAPKAQPSTADNLELMAEKLREPEATVARMQKRRASEQKSTSIDSTDQLPSFDDPITEPIKSMKELQKSISTDVEDDIILHTLQRGDTTRESSAQSESVVFGRSTSQQSESEDAFNENSKLSTLHRMNTIATERSAYKPQNLLLKSVTIDDTVKYIDPDKSTEESAGSFNLDDTISAHVRNKMVAYSMSEADSDYFYESSDHSNRAHDDFNISTAIDNFPSTDTDTTIISAAATKIQAGARGFLTRRRFRRASMDVKPSPSEIRTTSFGNEAIDQSLDQLVEEENEKRMSKAQYHRQVGVNSLPSALNTTNDAEHSSSPPTRAIIQSVDNSAVDLNIATTVSATTESPTATERQSTSSETDVNGTAEDSAQVSSSLDVTLAARRLTLQRGDAMRNDSTPDDDSNNGKQVDPVRSAPTKRPNITDITSINTSTASTIGTDDPRLIHQKTTVEAQPAQGQTDSDAATAIKMEKIKWFALRQNSMPVQIDSEVFRVLPKHMRKRIKSADVARKRIRLPRD